jgi:hypothetical protein
MKSARAFPKTIYDMELRLALMIVVKKTMINNILLDP